MKKAVYKILSFPYKVIMTIFFFFWEMNIRSQVRKRMKVIEQQYKDTEPKPY